ncbi:MAG: phosphoadenosine phosphosulfate reductase [Rhodobacteraceae bacterium]|nr:phosphoadenosine phosphosulfate reductase [Paracoccaceae bacterium]
MQDGSNSLDQSLAGLSKKDWKESMVKLAEEHGMYQPLGDRHFATFVDLNNTLLVSFETIQGIHSLSDQAQPLGFDMVKAQGWSHLCVISDGDTWFRDNRIYGFFDQLIDDGFFEEFDRVIFYGAGPCGYAAAAYSVASPGATVVTIQPQATLDPRITEWDERFVEMRRTSFTDRFGYAPDMLDAADQAFILYDPRQDLDAMHSALFERPNVTRLRLRNMGGTLQTRMIDMDILYRILSLAGAGKLTEKAFFKLYRARRDNVAYLRSLMSLLDAEERPYLNTLLCRNVTSRQRAPKFRRRLEALEQQAQDGDFRLPPVT